MLNSYSNSKTTININAVSGTLVKNYKKSFILDYHLDSSLGKALMDSDPKLRKYTGCCFDNGYEHKPVVILQTMVCGDLRVIAEIMWKSDFEELFDESGGD